MLTIRDACADLCCGFCQRRVLCPDGKGDILHFLAALPHIGAFCVLAGLRGDRGQ